MFPAVLPKFRKAASPDFAKLDETCQKVFEAKFLTVGKLFFARNEKIELICIGIGSLGPEKYRFRNRFGGKTSEVSDTDHG